MIPIYIRHREMKKRQLLKEIGRRKKVEYLYLSVKLNIKMKKVYDFINEIKRGK